MKNILLGSVFCIYVLNGNTFSAVTNPSIFNIIVQINHLLEHLLVIFHYCFFSLEGH